MARLPKINAVLAERLGREPGTVATVTRALREGGVLRSARGQAAPSLTAAEAAACLAGVLAGGLAKHAVSETGRILAAELRDPAARPSADLGCLGFLDRRGMTFGEALTELIAVAATGALEDDLVFRLLEGADAAKVTLTREAARRLARTGLGYKFTLSVCPTFGTARIAVNDYWSADNAYPALVDAYFEPAGPVDCADEEVWRSCGARTLLAIGDALADREVEPRSPPFNPADWAASSSPTP